MAQAEAAAQDRGLLARAPPTGLVLCGIASVQFGSALATTLFDEVGPGGAVLLRLVSASIVLVAISRPRIRVVRGGNGCSRVLSARSSPG